MNRILTAARLFAHWGMGIVLGALLSKDRGWIFAITFGSILYLTGQFIASVAYKSKGE